MKKNELIRQNKNRVYELTLGYTCNSNCQFCSIKPQKRGINKTTKEALSDILRAKQEGFRVIGFGGGEPTIRNDIIDLVRFAKKLGFETIRIQTNGIALAYKDFCEKLVFAGVNFFKFSIHGHKAEIHDKLTRVPGSFERVVKGLDNIRSLEIKREIDIVVNKLNYKFLPQFIEFFSLNKGISNFVLIYPMHTGRMKENAKVLGIKISEVLPYIRESVDLASKLQLDKYLVMNIPSCLLEKAGMKDSVYQKTLPKRLNLKVNTPEEIVEDADEDAIGGKIKISKCNNCSFSSHCQGIWKNYLKVFGMGEFN